MLPRGRENRSLVDLTTAPLDLAGKIESPVCLKNTPVDHYGAESLPACASAGRVYVSPKPSLPSRMAMLSFSRSVSKSAYPGRFMVLKHVCETGSVSPDT